LSEIQRSEKTKNIFLLLGNTYNTITNKERKQFIENINTVSKTGDLFFVEIDTKSTKKSQEVLFKNKKVKKQASTFLNGVLKYANEKDIKLKDIYKSKISVNDNKYCLFSQKYKKNSKTYRIPLMYSKISNKMIQKEKIENKSLFKEFVKDIFDENFESQWHNRCIINLFNTLDTDQTWTLGIYEKK